mmetsp:Transcript_25642/g.56555  ORF Transcript_25642/g.56555 Transcript_25642/m.56555 type:complete len:241 (-) Transcript_25642:50-772(-)
MEPLRGTEQAKAARAERFLQYSLKHRLPAVLTGEFIGTYFLVLTIGCSLLTGSLGSALSIGAALMAMTYAIFPVSGAHFNPAVTLAVFITRSLRHEGRALESVLYVLVQLLAGFLGGISFELVNGNSFPLGPVGRYHWVSAASVEALYTAALCYVFLSVTKGSNQFFGAAIGFTVTAAAVGIGSVSACSLNPAVSFGIAIAHAFRAGIQVSFQHFPLYSFAQFAGSGLGVVLFRAVNPSK